MTRHTDRLFPEVPPLHIEDIPPGEQFGAMPLEELIAYMRDGVALFLDTDEHGSYEIDCHHGQFTFEIWFDVEEGGEDMCIYSEPYSTFDALLTAESSRPAFMLSAFELLN